MQAIYTPVPRSENASVLKLYEKQGCTLHPDYVPGHIVIYKDGRLKYREFDSFNYVIVYFCP